MRKLLPYVARIMSCASVALLLSSCATTSPSSRNMSVYQGPYNPAYTIDDEMADYAPRMPEQWNTNGKKMILVNPNVHAWGAYDADGRLVRAGMATAGAAVCPPDANASDCRTSMGAFHIRSLGAPDCFSREYPRPHGGGLMPYCMFFHNGQALHGAPDSIVVNANLSHGCVRMRIPDAEWMRNEFAQVGTKVVVEPYDE